MQCKLHMKLFFLNKEMFYRTPYFNIRRKYKLRFGKYKYLIWHFI